VILGGPREAGSRAPYKSFCIRPMQNLEERRTETGCLSKGICPVTFKCLLACDVTPYDRFEGYNLRFLDEDGAALKLLPVLVQLFRHLVDARGHDVVRNDVSQLVEPEERKFRQDTAFVRNAL
jgi:hypothetical protein